MSTADPIAGLAWSANGQATLSGALLDLVERLDRAFVDLARRWTPVELRFPPVISACELERVDYFSAFPHLATFAVCLDPEDDNLESFVTAGPVGPDGALELSRLAPVRGVLTPAACYHLYIHHAGEIFAGPRYFTTSATCWRREASYVPLERQWSFTMREVVCMGTPEETRKFLDSARASLDAFVEGIALPVRWEVATDPFFRPASSPGHLMQLVDPTKHELVFEDRLALASANSHQDHFGRAFSIRRAGEPAHSACLAFGLERWLGAFVRHFGPEPGSWPGIGS